MGRILLELTRGDAARGFVFNGALSTSQLLSLVLIVIGIGLHVRVSRRAAA
jgi:prolipoprotein diacylglyceryltransferase